MVKRFENRVVIITGASSGIGKETAKCFAEEGAQVVLAARNEHKGNEIAQEIVQAGGSACFIKTDVCVAADVECLVNEVMKKYGKLDFAFNNAGTLIPPNLLTECTEDDWDRVITTNLKSVWLCMKYQIPKMLESGGGSIVNNASIWGTRASKFPVAIYNASKHGVIGLTKSAAMEFAEQKVRVNAVCPGWILTDEKEDVVDDKLKQQGYAAHPVGRLGKPKEIAHAVMYLCDDNAGFTTGHSLMVDGGIHANGPIY